MRVAPRRERLYSLLDRTATYYERVFWEAAAASEARDYMRGRGFTDEILREFRVGYAPDSRERVTTAMLKGGYAAEEILAADLGRRKKNRQDELIDRFRGRIMFPTSDARGRVRGFGARTMGHDDGPKYLNTSEGEVYSKREVLYGISLARSAAAKAGRMVLCEGYTDVIAMHQAGVHNAVGIMGTSLTKEQVIELARVVSIVELCLDADNAGQTAMERAERVAAGSGLELRVVPLPAGLDPGDLIARDGAEALRERIGASVPYVVFQVGRVLEDADLSDAEGKDHAITSLRPVLAPVPASVLRDELVRKAAGTLELPEARLVALLGQEPAPVSAPLSMPGTGTGPASGSGMSGAAARPERPPAVARERQAERAFLAMCLASPDLGAQALERVDPDALFLDDALRRTARLLAASLPGEVPDPPDEDPELVVVLEDLRARAGRGTAQRGRSVSADELEHARLLLELDRLRRERKYLIEHGAAGGSLPKVAAAYDAARTALNAIVTRLERPV